MIFSYLKPILDRSDTRIAFFTCHSDLSEIHHFIRSFAYWLRSISYDGLKPLPGELYMDPSRDAYNFFGIGRTLSKSELKFLIWALWIENKLGLFKTAKKDGKSGKRMMSENHAFLEIMNYIRTRMPVYIKQSGFEPESLVWQSPGICVVNDGKLVYRVSSIKNHLKLTFSTFKRSRQKHLGKTLHKNSSKKRLISAKRKRRALISRIQ